MGDFRERRSTKIFVVDLRSDPGKRVLPVSISAMMQPTDLQVALYKSKVRDVVAIHPVGYDLKYKYKYKPEVDSVVVVHPVEHDLRSKYKYKYKYKIHPVDLKYKNK